MNDRRDRAGNCLSGLGRRSACPFPEQKGALVADRQYGKDDLDRVSLVVESLGELLGKAERLKLTLSRDSLCSRLPTHFAEQVLDAASRCGIHEPDIELDEWPAVTIFELCRAIQDWSACVRLVFQGAKQLPLKHFDGQGDSLKDAWSTKFLRWASNHYYWAHPLWYNNREWLELDCGVPNLQRAVADGLNGFMPPGSWPDHHGVKPFLEDLIAVRDRLAVQPVEVKSQFASERRVSDTNASLSASARQPGGRPTSTRRGRPKADYDTIQREANIATDWQREREAGTYKADFAKLHGLSLKELNALLDRHRKRKSRSE